MKVVLSFLLFVALALWPSLWLPSIAASPTSPVRNTGPAVQPAVDLDLSSSSRSVPASALGCANCGSLIMNVGGARQAISGSDMLTPAQFAVAAQLLTSGSQSLRLSASGAAFTGTLNLFGAAATNVGNLIVPRGVTVYSSNSSSGLSLTGDLINSGTVVGLIGTQSMLANISANNIINALGAIITVDSLSTATAGRLAASTLNLTAAGQLVNFGVITTPGRLNISANEVINAGGSAGSSGVIQGAAINIQSSTGRLSNSGSITALSGPLNVFSNYSNSLIIDNTSGTLAALKSNINLSGIVSPFDIALFGGNVSAKEINLLAPGGKVAVDVQTLDGVLNAEACDAHVTAATENLVLGNMKLSGDPTFYNIAGDVTINTDLVFAGQPLTIVASRNILSAPGAGFIDTSSSTGNGGSVAMLAGMDFSSSGGPVSTDPFAPVVLSIRGGSLTGGSIRLAGASPITSFDTRSTAVNGSGGQIDLVASQGVLAGTGQIILPRAVTVKTGGNGTGFAGAIRMFSSSDSGTGIDIGSIDTSGGTRGFMYQIPNIIQLINDGLPFASVGHPVAVPGNVSAGNIYLMNERLAMTQGPFTITNGQYTPGAFYGDVGEFRSGSIHAENVFCTNCTRILINGGGTVSLQSLSSLPTVVSNKTIMQVMLRSTSPFIIGPAATTNGVKLISANAGPLAGNAGDIRILQLQTGGIIVNTLASISATTTNGNGGSIQLATDGDMGGLVTPPGPHGPGTLSLPSGGLSVDGAGANGFGGTIYLNAGKLLVSDSAGPLRISANGSGDGSGGTIGITIWSGFLNPSTADIVVGHGAHQLEVSATGGSVGSTSGDGGTVFVQAGRNLTIDTSAVSASPLGANGNGAFQLFTAGANFATGGYSDFGLPVSQGTGLLTINGALHSDGRGTGAGGVLLLTSSDPTGFVVGGAPGCSQCTTGALTANGGTDIGMPGGLLGVQTYGSMTVNSAPSVNPSPAGGDGGQLLFSTATGGITFNVSQLNADATGGASDAFSGGMINISTPTVQLNSPLQLSALPVGSGNGGTVYVEVPGGTLNVGTGANPLTVAATGGSVGSSGGNGGIVTLIASDLHVDPAGIVASPLGTSGAGARFVLQGLHRITIANDLDVSGVGNGAGGLIRILNNSSLPPEESVYRYLPLAPDGTYASAIPADQPFTVGGLPGCTNCSVGNLVANGGAISGKGGSILVSANQGVIVNNPSSLSVNASPGGGAGGRLTFLSPNGAIDLASGSYAVDAVGGGSTGFNGGVLRIDGMSINITGLNPTAFSANGTANGGSINFVARGSGDFTVGLDPSGLATSFSAVGGSSGNDGNGGTVLIQTAGNLTANPLNVTMNPSGANGKGGSLSLTAGSNLTVLASLNADGVGTGNGGALVLSSNGAQPFVVNDVPGCTNCVAGTLSALPGVNGTAGGSITVTSGSGLVINSMTDLQYGPNAGGGAGGNLTLSAGSGTLVVPAVPISASASGGGSFSGGKLALSGALIQTNGGGPLQLVSNGTGSGNGGIISYSQTTGNVAVGSGPSQVSFIANGGSPGSSAGNAGSVSVSSNGDLIVDVSALTSQALGTNGNGATLSLAAGHNLLVTGSIVADGVGSGNGGVVSLAYGTLLTGPSSLLVGGTASGAGQSSITGIVSANAPGAGAGGTINFQTKPGSALNLIMNSSASALSNTGAIGSIQFLPAGNIGSISALNVGGSGILLGQITAQAGVINIALSSQTQPLTIGSLTSTSGGITIQASSVSLPTAASQVVSSGGNVKFISSTIVNNGLIQARPVGASIIFSSTGSLSVTGSGVLSGNVVFSSGGSAFISQGGILGNIQGNASGGYQISLGSTLFTNGSLANNLIGVLSQSEALYSSASVNTATQTQAALLTAFTMLQPSVIQQDPFGLKKKDDAVEEQKESAESSVATSGIKSDTVVFTQTNQIFSGSFGGGSDVVETGSPGTVVENEQTVVYLHKGELALDTGSKDGMNVSAGNVSIKIGTDATALVKYSPGRPVEVVVLAGKDRKAVTVSKDNEESLVGPGEQILLSDQDLSDEELISPDGNASIDCHVQVQTRRMVKRTVSIEGVAGRSMIVAGVLVRLPGQVRSNNANKHVGVNTSSVARMRKHIEASLPAHATGVAYAEVLHSADGTDSLKKSNDKASEPFHFYNARGTIFSQNVRQIDLQSGSMVLAPPEDVVIHCDDIKVKVRKEGIVSIDKNNSSVKIKACTGLNDVQVNLEGGRSFILPCGQEAVIVKSGFERHAMNDGIARRAQNSFKSGSEYKVILSEFSIPTLMLNVTHLSGIAHPQSEHASHLRDRMLRTAVAIQYARNSRGRFVNDSGSTSSLAPGSSAQ
jgi:hypothetical protein